MIGTIQSPDGTTECVQSTPRFALTAAAESERREVELAPDEHITRVNAWLSNSRERRLGSVTVSVITARCATHAWLVAAAQRRLTSPPPKPPENIACFSQITLSSCRVLRFGASWDGWQHTLSPPAPHASNHVLGFFGSGAPGGGGGLTSFGMVHAHPPGQPQPPPPRPYSAARDGVSLSFLRDFYEAHVRPLDEAAERTGAPAITTDVVAKTLVMSHTWDQTESRGRCGSCAVCWRASVLCCGDSWSLIAPTHSPQAIRRAARAGAEVGAWLGSLLREPWWVNASALCRPRGGRPSLPRLSSADHRSRRPQPSGTPSGSSWNRSRATSAPRARRSSRSSAGSVRPDRTLAPSLRTDLTFANGSALPLPLRIHLPRVQTLCQSTSTTLVLTLTRGGRSPKRSSWPSAPWWSWTSRRWRLTAAWWAPSR